MSCSCIKNKEGCGFKKCLGVDLCNKLVVDSEIIINEKLEKTRDLM